MVWRGVGVKRRDRKGELLFTPCYAALTTDYLFTLPKAYGLFFLSIVAQSHLWRAKGRGFAGSPDRNTLFTVSYTISHIVL
jgi:hypothetical protein